MGFFNQRTFAWACPSSRLDFYFPQSTEIHSKARIRNCSLYTHTTHSGYYIDVTWASWGLKSPLTPLFVQQLSTVLNPIFSKKVQGQKHPGRWGIVENQIHSIKVLFKTYTKGHKHPSIRLISKSETQLVNQRKQKVAFSPGTMHSPEIQSYWQRDFESINCHYR